MISDDFFLGFLDAGHVIEGDLDGVFGHQAGPALAEGHGLAAAGLHLAHEEDPDAHQDQHGQPGDQQGGVPGAVILGLGGDFHAFALEKLDEVGVLRGVAFKGLAVLLFPVDFLPLEGNGFYFVPLDQINKLAVGQGGLTFGMLSGVEIVKQKNHHQADEQPESNIFIKGTQAIIHVFFLTLRFNLPDGGNKSPPHILEFCWKNAR